MDQLLDNMDIVFLAHAHFDLNVFLPIVILLGISALIPVLLTVLRAKFIPVFVVQIFVGLLFGSFATKNLFAIDNNLNPLMEGLYIIGMGVLLFLSGLDTDFSEFKKHKKEDKSLRIGLLTNLLLLAVIGLSVAFSFLFMKYMTNKVYGVILLTIILSSTFASIVIPIVHDEGLAHTTIGKIIDSYSTKAELLSILGLSGIMLSMGISHNTNAWYLVIVIVVLVLLYIVNKYFRFNIFSKISGGIVHFSVRLIFAVLLGLMVVCYASGVEYILGAFLAGMVIKAAHMREETVHKLEIIGYGIFVPIFFILVGVKVGMIMPIQEFIKVENLTLILIMFVVLVVVKIPFFYLCKWFKLSTTIQTTMFVACTLIVSIAALEIGVFEVKFTNALIIASCLTCLIPPILFDITKSFGFSKKENDERITNPVKDLTK